MKQKKLFRVELQAMKFQEQKELFLFDLKLSMMQEDAIVDCFNNNLKDQLFVIYCNAVFGLILEYFSRYSVYLAR